MRQAHRRNSGFLFGLAALVLASPSFAQTPTPRTSVLSTQPAKPAAPATQGKAAGTVAPVKPLALKKVKAPSLRVAHEPRDIIVQIYKLGAGEEGAYDGPSAFDDKRVRRAYFSKSLLAALAAMEKKEKATDSLILDFDPVTNSQDPDVKNLSITEEMKTADKATIAAKFWSYNETQPSIVRYDFVKEGKAWKLKEIRGESPKERNVPPWSLRKIIAR